MKFTRTGIAALAVLVIAATALVLTSIGSAKPAKTAATPLSRWRSSPTSAACRTARSTSSRTRAGRRSARSSASRRASTRRTRRVRAYPEQARCGKAGYNMIFAVGFLNYTALNAVAPRFPNLKFAGIDEPYVLFSKKPKNATGVVFAEHEAGYLVGYLAGLEMKKEKFNTISAVGANNVPAIVPLHQRLHPGREEGEAGHQGARELRQRPDLLRSGEVPRDGAEPDRPGLARRLPGRRRLRPRRARRRRRRRRSGASASTPTSATSVRTS